MTKKKIRMIKYKEFIDFSNTVKKLSKIDINMEISLGSKYQESLVVNSLALLLKSWKKYISGSHKKNKIKIEIRFNQKEKKQ